MNSPQTGTVSHGTMREQDLIPCFMKVLADRFSGQPYHLAAFFAGQPALQKLCPDGVNYVDDADPLWNSDEVSFFLNEVLFDALNAIAPKGFHFGSHEGDGSDYGFWPNEEQEDCAECGEPLQPGEGVSFMGASVKHRECLDGPRNPQHVRDQWAGLRSRISLAQICNMLRQDVEAEPNLPEPEIIRAKNLLTSVEEILQKRGV